MVFVEGVSTGPAVGAPGQRARLGGRNGSGGGSGGGGAVRVLVVGVIAVLVVGRGTQQGGLPHVVVTSPTVNHFIVKSVNVTICYYHKSDTVQTSYIYGFMVDL